MVSINIDRVVTYGETSNGELEDLILKMLYEAGGVPVSWEAMYSRMFYTFDRAKLYLPGTQLCDVLGKLLWHKVIRQQFRKELGVWYGLSAGAWLRLASAE